MPTLDELLTDAALTDDIKITLPGGKETTVGSLREFAKTQRETAVAAQRDFEVKRREAEAAQEKAKKLAADALKLWEDAEAKTRNAPTDASRPGDIDWDNDPVYRPIGQRLSKLEKETLAAQAAEIKQLREALAAGFKFVTEDYNERRWNAIPKDQRPKDKTWRDFMESAEKGNIRDSHGLFDPIEAYNRATADDRRAAELKEAEKRGEERAKKAAAAAALPRPGGTPVPVQRPQNAFKDLKDALAAAQSDPEILRIANGEDALA